MGVSGYESLYVMSVRIIDIALTNQTGPPALCREVVCPRLVGIEREATLGDRRGATKTTEWSDAKERREKRGREEKAGWGSGLGRET